MDKVLVTICPHCGYQIRSLDATLACPACDKEIDTKPKKVHRYLVSIMYVADDTLDRLYIKVDTKQITLEIIDDIEEAFDAIVLNLSYLGHMTDTEWGDIK